MSSGHWTGTKGTKGEWSKTPDERWARSGKEPSTQQQQKLDDLLRNSKDVTDEHGANIVKNPIELLCGSGIRTIDFGNGSGVTITVQSIDRNWDMQTTTNLNFSSDKKQE